MHPKIKVPGGATAYVTGRMELSLPSDVPVGEWTIRGIMVQLLSSDSDR